MIQNKRIDWIDISKGIAIILMVLGHTSIPEPISKYIWSFHMPLFFMVSGMMFKPKYKDILEYITKRVKTLIVPYCFFSAIVFVSYYGTEYWRPYEIYMGWTGYALWFIPVLFLSELFLFEISKIKDKRYVFAVLLCLTILGWLLSYFNIKLPYKVDAVPFASIFLLIGYFGKSVFLNYKPNLCITFVLLCVSIALSQILPKTGVGANAMGYVLPNIINAVVGTCSIFAFSQIIEAKAYCFSKPLIWCGSNSIFIMAFSQILGYWILTFLNTMPLPSIVAMPLRYALLFGMMWMFAELMKKYVPQLVGKWK